MDSNKVRAGKSRPREAATPRHLWFERLAIGATLPAALLAEHLPPAVTVPAVLIVVAIALSRFFRDKIGPSMATLPIWLLACVLVPMSVIVSPLREEVSWPRAVCLLWSLALFGMIANDISPARLRLPVWIKLFLGMGTGFVLLNFAVLKLPENEAAGVLTLFFPMALAMAVAPRAASEAPRVMWIAVALLVLAAIGMTGSRGALIGTAASTGALVVILGRKKGTVIFVVGAILAIGASVALWQTARFRTFVLGGTIQGASMENFTTGRFSIWDSSQHAIRDLPFTGTGLGVLGGAFPRVYPTGYQSRALEDAHNQFLQAAADFGVIGGLIWIGVWCTTAFLCFRLLRQFPSRHLPYFAVAGCAAGLAGHFAYSLGDSVSPGWPGGFPFWFLAALVIRLQRQRILKLSGKKRRGASSRTNSLASGVAFVALTVAAVTPALFATENRKALGRLRMLLNGSRTECAASHEDAKTVEKPICRSRWLRGLVAQAAGDHAARTAEWKALIQCSRRHLSLVRAAAPSSRELADAAIETWPDEAVGYFWKVPLVQAENPEEAIALLRLGLKRAPSNGRQWQKLGEILSADDKDLPGALEAYGKACDNGDPGANGCSNAGYVAEALGRPEEALIYYRKSNWEPARRRGRELEEELRKDP